LETIKIKKKKLSERERERRKHLQAGALADLHSIGHLLAHGILKGDMRNSPI
jgi:hypothetical protein